MVLVEDNLHKNGEKTLAEKSVASFDLGAVIGFDTAGRGGRATDASNCRRSLTIAFLSHR